MAGRAGVWLGAGAGLYAVSQKEAESDWDLRSCRPQLVSSPPKTTQSPSGNEIRQFPASLIFTLGYLILEQHQEFSKHSPSHTLPNLGKTYCLFLKYFNYYYLILRFQVIFQKKKICTLIIIFLIPHDKRSVSLLRSTLRYWIIIAGINNLPSARSLTYLDWLMERYKLSSLQTEGGRSSIKLQRGGSDLKVSFSPDGKGKPQTCSSYELLES